MQRSYCIGIVFVIALFGSISGVYAQEDGDKAIAYAYERVKSPGELSQLPQFTSLEEAMREPENVYKLSLANDDMKNFPMEVLMFKNLQVLNLADNKIKAIPAGNRHTEKPHRTQLARQQNQVNPPRIWRSQQPEDALFCEKQIAQIPRTDAWAQQFELHRPVVQQYVALRNQVVAAHLPRCHHSVLIDDNLLTTHPDTLRVRVCCVRLGDCSKGTQGVAQSRHCVVGIGRVLYEHAGHTVEVGRHRHA